jgi:hypothetical protein
MQVSPIDANDARFVIAGGTVSLSLTMLPARLLTFCVFILYLLQATICAVSAVLHSTVTLLKQTSQAMMLQ